MSPCDHIRSRICASVLLASVFCCTADAQDPLRFSFDGKHGQVEVGGPSVGLEFHHSRPVPSRISFFQPVANSIDLSTDYWKRDESIPYSIAITAGSQHFDLARESWKYVLRPNGVTFLHLEGPAQVTLSYAFGERLPIVVATLTIINTSKNRMPVDVATHLLLALRTCQTYTRLDSSMTEVVGAGEAISASFEEIGAQRAGIFSNNLGLRPDVWSTDGVGEGVRDNGESLWLTDRPRKKDNGQGHSRRRAAAMYHYTALLEPGDLVEIVQSIGSTSSESLTKTIERVPRQWRSDISAYDNRIHQPGGNAFLFQTGDKVIDRSAAWSRSLVEANQHFLDGKLVPMPCPAEYNFYFTHDVLLSGLGIVNTDADRVRRDLLWITEHASGTVIPHAFYWRDSSFQTELCTPANWNHLWFLMLSSRYVRVTHDTATGLRLLPFADQSVRDMLTQVGPDGLFHAPRPDWWDLGWNDGPRSYLTALFARALDEYVFLRSFLGKRDSLAKFEERSSLLKKSLQEKLWNDRKGYLMDRNGNDPDNHIFAGPLVAAVYRSVPDSMIRRMVQTAEQTLLAPGVGIRAVMPPDFHVDSVKKYYDIKGNEAGDAYKYINGGVWPHLNAWYALALLAAGRTSDAAAFTRSIMTIDGVASSPSGIPAMYEYRISDTSSPDYGVVDKPSFLWAGGFNLYTVYQLAGLRDGPWNVAFDPLSIAWPSVTASWIYGGLATLKVATKAASRSGIVCDGTYIPSYVLPVDLSGSRTIEVAVNGLPQPVLVSMSAIVQKVWLDKSTGSLKVECSSFDGHNTDVVVASPNAVSSVAVDGKVYAATRSKDLKKGFQRWGATIPGSSRKQLVTFTFAKSVSK